MAIVGGESVSPRSSRPTRLLDLSYRLILVSISACLIFFNFGLFNAASAVDVALESLSQPLETAAARANMARQVENTLERQWSQPLAWHGGATEAAGWAALIQANGPVVSADRIALENKSAAYSWSAVHLSPITPTAWTRLQELQHRGINAGCERNSCVERSYMASPMTNRPKLECARFSLSEATAQSESKLLALAQSDIGATELSDCVRPLGPDAVYHALRLRRQ
jgi:hypothetical protein